MRSVIRVSWVVKFRIALCFKEFRHIFIQTSWQHEIDQIILTYVIPMQGGNHFSN